MRGSCGGECCTGSTEQAIRATAKRRYASRAQLTTAQLNLDDTTITAPTDGWVADLGLRPGAVVAANQPLFSFVEDTAW